MAEGTLLKNFTKIFLLTAGISKHPNPRLWEHLYSLFVTAIYVIEIIGNYVGYKSFDLNVEQIVEMIFRLVGHTYVLLIHWFIKLHKKSVLKIIYGLCGNNYPEFVGTEVIKVTERSFKQIGMIILSMYSGTMLTYMLLSIFVGVFTKLRAAEVYIYLFPYWYSCQRSNSHRLCWNVESFTSYFLKNGSQFGLMFVEQLSLFNSVSLFLLLILNFRAHRTVLEKRLRKLNRRIDIVNVWKSANNVTPAETKTVQEMVFDKGLVRFIKYHQFLRSTAVDAKPVLTGLLSLILCFIWLLMLFTLCFIMVEESGSFIYRLKVGSLVIMTVLVFLLTCYLGELMSSLNNSFAEFLYNTSWYNLPAASRKNIIIELMLLQQSYRIRAFGLYFINMERFALSIRTMYTVLNMLLITLKKV